MNQNEAASIAMLIYKDIKDYCRKNSDLYEEFCRRYKGEAEGPCKGDSDEELFA